MMELIEVDVKRVVINIINVLFFVYIGDSVLEMKLVDYGYVFLFF